MAGLEGVVGGELAQVGVLVGGMALRMASARSPICWSPPKGRFTSCMAYPYT